MSDEALLAENTRLKIDNQDKRSIVKYMSFAVVALTVGIVYVASTQSTILVPPGGELKGKAQIEKNRADLSYLEWVTDFICNRSMNVIPDTVEMSIDSITHLVAPEYYGKFRMEILKQAQYIKTNNISQSFYIQDVDYKTPNKIIVHGIVKQSIGQSASQKSEGVLEIGYQIDNKLFRLTNLQRFSKKEYEEYLIKEKLNAK